jgi:mono/diheme cytochrome c family protein
MNVVVRAAVAAALLEVLAGCGGGGGGPTTPPTPPPPTSSELLSTTGLYTNIATKTVDPRNRPWVPQYVLWSDGGAKERWIFLPPGTRIDTSDMDRWVFPVGTKIYKEFVFQGRRLETRIIEKVGSAPTLDSWTFKAFVWRADESDATLAPDAGVANAGPTAFGTTHDIPSVTNCRSCHNRGGDAVLGFEALQLSADRDPLAIPAGQLAAGDVTLRELANEGLITHNPDSQPRVISSTPAGRWSMGLMHGNCGNCHNPASGSAGGSTGLDLRHRHSVTREVDEPAYATTVNRLNIVYQVEGTVLGVNSYRILAGQPDRSAVVLRMRARGNSHAMPPIASKVVDMDALGLVTDWVNRLPR